MGDAKWLLGAALLLTGCAAEGQPLLLDAICRSSIPSSSGTLVAPCSASGDVELTSGVSKDVIGVRFGPSGVGDFRIRLNAITATTQAEWSFEVLAASTRPEGSRLFRTITWGSCGATCPADPVDVEVALSNDFEWAIVVDDAEGATVDPFLPSPDDAALVFRGADIDLVDVATPGVDQYRDDFFF